MGAAAAWKDTPYSRDGWETRSHSLYQARPVVPKEMTMTDRLQNIKEHWKNGYWLSQGSEQVLFGQDIDWLIAEVERLREEIIYWKEFADETRAIHKNSCDAWKLSIAEVERLKQDIAFLGAHHNEDGSLQINMRKYWAVCKELAVKQLQEENERLRAGLHQLVTDLPPQPKDVDNSWLRQRLAELIGGGK